MDPTRATPEQALDAGIAAANAPDDAGRAREREKADVQAWMRRIEEARKFDAEARKQYARDRRYARGDSGFEVDTNLIGTFVDILVAFLYAQDPDVDVTTAPSAEPPDMEALRDTAEDAAGGAGPDPAAARARFEGLRARYEQRQRDNKAFADTLAIVVSRLWRDGRMKRHAKRWVRSALTIGTGWLKATWQTRTAPDPITQQQIADLQDNIRRVAALREQLQDEPGQADCDAKQAEYQRVLASLETRVERVVARGFVIDLVQAEDVQVAPGVLLAEYLDAPWIVHRAFLRAEDAQAQFGLPQQDMVKAARWRMRKPQTAHGKDTAMDADDVRPEDADGYESAASGGPQPQGGDGFDYVRVEEIWDRDANAVLTAVEGIDRWVRRPYAPDAATRFYPFFQLAIGEIDGERHPQSLVWRSHKLQDEYSRVRSAFAEHRRRTRPKTVFNRGLLSPEDARRVESAVTQEMVGVDPIQPGADIRTLFAPVTYAQLDPMLYETQSIMGEMERIWGIQEALSQSIQTAKTATEAQIQQTGFHARTGAMRDVLEDALGELAQYTAEVALLQMDAGDVRAIAGDDAFWPEGMTVDDLPALVGVTIRAGSSGKPNTTADRQAWATLLPLLQQGIQTIGALRQSTPDDMADRAEALLRETFARAGDHADPDRFIPREGAQQPLPVAPPPPPAVPPGAIAAGQVPPPAPQPPMTPAGNGSP